MPFDLNHHGKLLESRGLQFCNWLIDDLIPFLESKYPFNSKKESRFLAGSGMGAIMTITISSLYKDIFSKYGIFSLSSWIFKDNRLYDLLDENGIASNSQYFIYVGDREGYSEIANYETPKVTKSYLEEFNKITSYLEKSKLNNIFSIVGEGYNHSEKSWRVFLPKFIDILK